MGSVPMLRRRNSPGAQPSRPWPFGIRPAPRYSCAGTGWFSPAREIAAQAAHLKYKSGRQWPGCCGKIRGISQLRAMPPRELPFRFAFFSKPSYWCDIR